MADKIVCVQLNLLVRGLPQLPNRINHREGLFCLEQDVSNNIKQAQCLMMILQKLSVASA